MNVCQLLHDGKVNRKRIIFLYFYETGKKADKYRIDLYEQALACDADMALELL